MKPVAVDIVTGFLGAGKTTLLTHVLGGALGSERVAVVMNELGDVSVDGRIVERLEHVERMVELEGGCVCCAIDDASFDAAIHELIARVDPTLIVLETTGAADPEPVRERLARAGLRLDAIITVVDAAALERALAETAVAARQIRAADFVLINKVDLVQDRELRRVRRRLVRLNRRALVWECERGRVPGDMLFATAARRYRDAAPAPPHVAGADGRSHALRAAGGRLLHASAEERISAFTWRGQAELDRRRFERFLAGLPVTIYRAKGFVRFAGATWDCVFNYTCGRYELNWIQLGDIAGAQAVFIGRDVLDVRDRVLDALRACEAT